MALFLNIRGRILAYRNIGTGTVNSVTLDMRLMVSLAVHTLATSVILVHNHPTGDLEPSKADIALTKRARKALNLIDVKLVDHFIISDKDGFSMFEHGFM